MQNLSQIQMKRIKVYFKIKYDLGM
jgi:hypothetical protein